MDDFVGKKKCQSQVGFVVGYFSRTDDNNGGMLYGLSIINGDYSNLEELKHKFKIGSGNPDDEYPKFTQENLPGKLSEEQWKEFPWGFSYLSDENRKCDKIGMIGMILKLWQICTMARCLSLWKPVLKF